MPSNTPLRPETLRPTQPRDNRVSFLWKPGSFIAELTYHDGTMEFAYRNGTSLEYTASVENTYKPLSWLSAYVRAGAIRLPSRAEGETSLDTLAERVRQFIHRYFECSPEFESVAVLYALHTWVYERFQAVPYLRFLGLAGTGKTRGTQTIGAVCYRPLVLAGAATPAAMFRMIEALGGTLLLDEADFSNSQIGNDVAKVLNCGYQSNLPVTRLEQDRNGQYIPTPFAVFGPKIINGRQSFQDDATESRCLSYSPSQSQRQDIPVQLPSEFEVEAGQIQNQALQWRLNNLDTFQIQEVSVSGLGNRSKQIIQPLLMLIEDMTDGEMRERYRADLITFVQERERQGREDNTHTAEAKLLATYLLLRSENGREPTCGEVAGRVRKSVGVEDSDFTWLSPQKVSRIFRGMGFLTHHSNRGSMLRIEPRRLQALRERYGSVTEPSRELSPQGDNGEVPVMVAA